MVPWPGFCGRQASSRTLPLVVVVVLVSLLSSCKIIPLVKAANDVKYSSELELMRYLRLFSNYVPPVDSVDSLNNLVVNITIKPEDIFGLTVDEHEDLWIDLSLCLFWNSSALTWIPSDFNNITYISVSKSSMWIPQFASGSHLFLGVVDTTNRLKIPIIVQSNGLTQWCPQVQLMLSCQEQGDGFDAFPADELKCISDITSIDSVHMPSQAANIHNFTYSKKDFRRMGDLFGDSGYRLQYMQTEAERKYNRIVVGIRRTSSQWLYQMTLPITLVALLCVINLWLDAIPHEDHDTRRLSTTFALIVINLIMIQMYSPLLVHCSRPPFILALLAQLIYGQLLFTTSYILLIRIDNCEKTQALYQRAQQMYEQTGVQSYVGQIRAVVLGWTFDKFDDDFESNNVDRSKDPAKEEPASASHRGEGLAEAVFLLVRILLTIHIVFNLCRFGFIFL